MSGKKLINSANDCVIDHLTGFVGVNPGLLFLKETKVVVRDDVQKMKEAAKVGIVSGGGSGHEPFAAGYIGKGMLTAVAAGEIFASPSPHRVLTAIRAAGLNNPGGVLIIVLNYTGDRLTFGLSKERAHQEGINAETFVIGEDCAFRSRDKTAGRRGLAGSVLLFKIAGAMSESGYSLPDMLDTCSKVAENIGSIGISFSPCYIPGKGATFTLGANEMELGLGVHGEAGVKRMDIKKCSECVDIMLEQMTNENNQARLSLHAGEEVIVLINNLGGLSMLEMNIFTKDALDKIRARKLTIVRVFSGACMTSLDMMGVSITILKIADKKWIEFIDMPTDAPSWPGRRSQSGMESLSVPSQQFDSFVEECQKKSLTLDVEKSSIKSHEIVCDDKAAKLLRLCILSACCALIENETLLNQLDTVAGDADTGSTCKAGALAIKTLIEKSGEEVTKKPVSLFNSMAHVVEESMGGASGGIYGLFFTAIAGALSSTSSTCSLFSAQSFTRCLSIAEETISKYSHAQPGDRTMLDPLHAASLEFSKAPPDQIIISVFRSALLAAEKACAETANMKALAGRASYVSPELITQEDPGARAVCIWLKAVYDECTTGIDAQNNIL